jgi:hypothetical protein
MTPWATRMLRAYLILLIALAIVGAEAQRRFVAHGALTRAVREANVAVADAYVVAERVSGPAAVDAWARAAGMVKPSEAGDLQAAAAGPAATLRTPPTPSLVVTTRWR